MPISTIGSNSLNATSDLTINGVTVGKGGGAVAGNTVLGSNANASNTTASTTTAIGFYALNANLTGANNTAVGQYAAQNTTASNNTAIGQGALTTNSSGGNNTAIGNSALNANSTASNNTAVGYQAGYTNVLGTNNTFIGYGAGYTSNAATTTGYNTAVGAYAGYSLTTGVKNTFIGSFQSGGTAGSGSAITTGSANSILGAYTGNGSGLDIRTSSNYIVLSDGDGSPRQIIDSNGKILLGGVTSAYAGNGISISSSQNTIWTNCTVQGQNGLVVQNSANSTGSVANLVAFNVGTAGGGTTIGSINYSGTATLYNATSDQRLKENIVDSETALTTLSQIKIRAFDWIDSKIHETHGVIAQELNEIAPQCVTEGVNHEDGSIDRPWQVDTSPLVPMLIKAIQELKTIVDAQAAEIAELKAKVA